jgi:hypothetical protein
VTGGRWPAVIAGAVAIALVGAGCSGVESLSFPNPPSTTAVVAPEPTLPSNLSAVDQAGVPGATTTTIVLIGGGHAELDGTVFGPGGPVGGAIVQADRIVGGQVASDRTTTAADGTWSIKKILGGRYRLRAWQSPGLVLTTPEALFLGATQMESVPLQVAALPPDNLQVATSPPVPTVGQVASLVVALTRPTVGPDGIVRYPGIPKVKVALTGGPDWTVYSSNPNTTDANGDALFYVSCQAAGSDPLSASAGGLPPSPLPVPPCAPPAPPPTTTTTSVPTTTTCPPGSTTTTTLAFGGTC